MRLRFHPAARVELNEAVDYYEESRTGLGWELYEEIEATIQRILEFPGAWSSQSEKTQRCLVHRFPYSVIYHGNGDEVRIIAIAHQKRRPEYWRSRLARR